MGRGGCLGGVGTLQPPVSAWYSVSGDYEHGQRQPFGCQIRLGPPACPRRLRACAANALLGTGPPHTSPPRARPRGACDLPGRPRITAASGAGSRRPPKISKHEWASRVDARCAAGTRGARPRPWAAHHGGGMPTGHRVQQPQRPRCVGFWLGAGCLGGAVCPAVRLPAACSPAGWSASGPCWRGQGGQASGRPAPAAAGSAGTCCPPPSRYRPPTSPSTLLLQPSTSQACSFSYSSWPGPGCAPPHPPAARCPASPAP